MSRSASVACVGCLVLLAFAARAMAVVSSPSNLFPDPFGYYQSTNTTFYPTLSGLVTLEGLHLDLPSGSIAPPVAPGMSVWTGTFSATAFMSFFGGPTVTTTNTDSSAIRITGTGDAPPMHTYDTEMLAMDLVGLPGPPGVIIRESPTIASPGSHTIDDTPPPYRIDSFFDVFTELSLDGGVTWTPATGPTHLVNPEPGALALLSVIMAPLLCRRHGRD